MTVEDLADIMKRLAALEASDKLHTSNIEWLSQKVGEPCPFAPPEGYELIPIGEKVPTVYMFRNHRAGQWEQGAGDPRNTTWEQVSGSMYGSYARPIPGTWQWAKAQKEPVCRSTWVHFDAYLRQNPFGEWLREDGTVLTEEDIEHRTKFTDWQLWTPAEPVPSVGDLKAKRKEARDNFLIASILFCGAVQSETLQTLQQACRRYEETDCAYQDARECKGSV